MFLFRFVIYLICETFLSYLMCKTINPARTIPCFEDFHCVTLHSQKILFFLLRFSNLYLLELSALNINNWSILGFCHVYNPETFFPFSPASNLLRATKHLFFYSTKLNFSLRTTESFLFIDIKIKDNRRYIWKIM